jgi:UDP-N-acetylmuramoyl-L-alanyl-D-glutamate--2,6-diaminopimelate ligase
VTAAKPGDVVVVLGKGHESGQEIAGVKHDFDDRLVLAAAIEATP